MRRRTLQASSRSGFTLVEMGVALFLFSVAFVAVVQLTLCVRHSQRKLWDQQVASESLANLAEEVRALPWDDLKAEKLTEMSLSDMEKEQLPEAKLSVTVNELNEPIAGKQIRLEISQGKELPSEYLTVWRFRTEESP